MIRTKKYEASVRVSADVMVHMRGMSNAAPTRAELSVHRRAAETQTAQSFILLMGPDSQQKHRDESVSAPHAHRPSRARRHRCLHGSSTVARSFPRAAVRGPGICESRPPPPRSTGLSRSGVGPWKD